MWTRRANAPPAESGRMGAAEAASFAPSPAKAGGKEGRLRAIGSRPDERHRAVLDGRTGWGGVSSRSARTVRTPSQHPTAVAGGGADATPRALSARPEPCPRAGPLRPRAEIGRGQCRGKGGTEGVTQEA